MSDIRQFLLARLDEDEAAARAAEQGEHIARHDPARVLADVAAKRAIVNDAETFRGLGTRVSALIAAGLDHAVGTLAAAYSDHPAYDRGWRP